VEASKIELKERFREAYKMNYKNTIQTKSSNFLVSVEKLETYINDCIGAF
jgi:hypothetical protein